MLKVCLITPTKGRHRHLERLVRFVLDQVSNDWVHLIYNNAEEPLKLHSSLPAEKFILINNHICKPTGKPYTSLGEIYNDIIEHIPVDANIVNFMDDDDVFFPDHVKEGIDGMLRGGKAAYKPKKSYYKHGKAISLVNNVMEPSIFVETEHIRKWGFSNETTAQHHQWLTPLLESGNIYVDEEGKPTYICDWSQEIKTFKTSGDPNNPRNFKNYEDWSKDKGDGIITPCSESWAQHYRQIKKTK